MAEAPRRTLKVASVVGRVFEAPILPGAYPELGDLDAGRSVTCDAAARGRPREPRPRAGPGLPLQARGDPGGRVREPAVRGPARCSTAGSAAASRRPRPDAHRPPPRPARPPLLAERRRRAQAARTSSAPPMRRGPSYANAAAHRLPRPAGAPARGGGAGRHAAQARQGPGAGRRLAGRPRRRRARRWRSRHRLADATGEGWAYRRAGRGRPQAGPLRRGDRAPRCGARSGLRGVGRRSGHRARCSTWPGRSPPSAATTPTRRRATRRASPSASAWRQGEHGRPATRTSASSPSTAATIAAARGLNERALAIRDGHRRSLGHRRVRRTTSG